MFYVSKREIEAIPFDELHKVVYAAGKAVKDNILGEALEEHERMVSRKVKALYANREDSYEGNQEEDFPFIPPSDEYIEEQILEARKIAFAKFAEKYDFKGNASWLLPQLTAFIAKMPLPKQTNGLIDSYGYFKQFGENDFLKGIHAFCTHSIRGDIVQKQYSPESRNYSALVPLLMMPHKKFNDVPYAAWSLDGLNKIMDHQLYAAMTCEFDKADVTNAELLSMRQAGMQYKTGKGAGTFRNPATSHKVYSLPAPFSKLPWLASVMLFQIWVAHPSHRTEYMVLDWKNWDNMPTPLIETALIEDVKPKRWTPPKSDSGDEWV